MARQTFQTFGKTSPAVLRFAFLAFLGIEANFESSFALVRLTSLTLSVIKAHCETSFVFA